MAKGRRQGESLKYLKQMLSVETDECILWPYSRTDRGYGIVHHDGLTWRVHRLVMKLMQGNPPEDKPLVLHKPLICHQPSCFNRRHLYYGNHADNEADKLLDGVVYKRGRKPGGIGGRRPDLAKVTAEQVRVIREDARNIHELAREYGITSQAIHAIKIRRSWKWVA